MNKTYRHYSKVLIILILLCGYQYKIIGQQAIPTKPSNSAFYSEIQKELVKGIDREDFLDACAIQWIPVKNNFSEWVPISTMLDQQLIYADFDQIMPLLANSSVVKVYTASMKSEDGRNIYCLEIGKGTKTVVFTAGVHAREVANPQFMLNFAIRLVSDYERGYVDMKDLLEKVKVVILPCVNPDGYNATILGNSSLNNRELFLAKKPNNQVYQAKSNARGIDLNRNFPSYSSSLLWKGKKEITSMIHLDRSLFYFAGDSLGSENETKVAMNFLMKYIPTAVRYVDWHSVGRIIYAGKPHLSDAFNESCTKTGKLISKHSSYRLLSLEDEVTGNGTDGTITDFAAEVAAGFAYNPTIGRLAPPDSLTLVRKSETFKYPCSVNTVETLSSLIKDKKTESLKPSTPDSHIEEWNKFCLYQLLLHLMIE